MVQQIPQYLQHHEQQTAGQYTIWSDTSVWSDLLMVSIWGADHSAHNVGQVLAQHVIAVSGCDREQFYCVEELEHCAIVAHYIQSLEHTVNQPDRARGKHLPPPDTWPLHFSRSVQHYR